MIGFHSWGGSIPFQLAEGLRPGPATPVGLIVVARRPAVYLGC